MLHKISDELITINTMMMVAKERGEIIRLSSQLNSVIEKAMEMEKASGNALAIRKENVSTAFIKFNSKELSKMPKEYRKQFHVGRLVAHVRKKDNGVYEIRCQIQNEKIAVSSKLLDTAKDKFITALNDLFKATDTPKIDKHVKLCDYMQEWLETVKKPTIKPVTYKDYIYSLNTYILPTFNCRELTSIKGFELQSFINQFTETGKNRTAQKLYQLLYAVFDYAVTDDIISKSPMQKIALPKYEQAHGVPLTRVEEKTLVSALIDTGSVYAQALTFLLYTGLRRSELASVEIAEGWVHLTTSKQRKGLKEKTRSIPISPMLARVLPRISLNAIRALSPAVLTKHIKDYFPVHHAHDLRHTFITRCQECGIQRELVSLWAGHAADSSTTTVVYTHLEQNKDHQESEMQKFDYLLF